MELILRRRSALITFLVGSFSIVGSLPAWAGTRDIVLLLNARTENQTCLKRVYFHPDSDPHPNEESTCTDSDGTARFLRQGRRTELRVFNRRFLTDYTITVDAVTNIQTGPAIRNLNEAENLTLGAPTFAAPTTKAGTEGLSTRTANSILFQLLDETTASQPESDLRSDFAVLDREHARIVEEIRAFRSTYQLLRGDPHSPPGTNCGKIAGAPDAENLFRCLKEEFDNDYLDPWNGTGPYSDEEEFRNVNIRVQDLIAAVYALGTALANTDLLSKEQKLETDVAQYENDLVTFRGNLEAARDAAKLAVEMDEHYRERLSRDRMKAILTDKLKAQGGTGAVVDDAELNALLDRYQDSYRRSLFIPRRRWEELGNLATEYLAHPYLANRPLASEFHADIAEARQALGYDLPHALDHVNAEQSKLLARVNEIYDNSEVLEPLSKQIDISGHSGNLVVYYTIRRVESFTRYTVTPVQGPGAATPAGTTGTALPPSKSTGPTGTTGTNATPANGSANPSSTTANGQTPSSVPSAGLNGIVVARGQFEVHDIYEANVVAAFAFSTLKDQSIAKQPQPLACTGTTTTPDTNCFAPILNSNQRQFEPIVGLDYYFHHMDTFPGPRCSKDVWQCLGVMGAVSVRRTDSYFLGLFVEPVIGVQIAGGANFGTQSTLQTAYKFGAPVDITGDFPTYQKRATGGFLSVGLDLAIFRKIFGKVTGIGTATTNTQGH